MWINAIRLEPLKTVAVQVSIGLEVLPPYVVEQPVAFADSTASSQRKRDLVIGANVGSSSQRTILLLESDEPLDAAFGGSVNRSSVRLRFLRGVNGLRSNFGHVAFRLTMANKNARYASIESLQWIPGQRQGRTCSRAT